ncbi:MAG: Bacterial extracellular solute-binding protein family 3 [Oscillospiraceae bacterium]|jgi:polar amino acid transport system substrate-binding protein|nr:Bacterial extracellular solute-binding protein family 3 [Oscillospiraceae bacterium]
MMKKVISMALAAVLAVGVLAGCSKQNPQSLENIKKAGKIVMYTNAAFPPFEYREGSNVAGVDVDIANEIAKDIGVTLEIKDVEFETIIGAVQSGKCAFGAAGMTVKPERLEQVDFSTKYVKSKQYLILKKGSTVKTIEDLKGKKVGVQTATTGNLILDDEISEGVLKGNEALKTYDDAIIASQDLIAGRIDAVVIDKLPAESIAKTNEGLQAIEMVYADGSNTEEEYAICVQKGNKELLDSINSTLDKLIKAGKIDEYVLNHTSKK